MRDPLTNSDDTSTYTNDPSSTEADELKAVPAFVSNRSKRRHLSKLERLQVDLSEANRLADKQAAVKRKKRKQVKASRRANRK